MTRADVVRWLRENPAELAGMLTEVRVAGPWRGTLGGWRSMYGPLSDLCQVLPAQHPAVGWEARVAGLLSPLGVYATEDEARSAADAYARERGWSLT